MSIQGQYQGAALDLASVQSFVPEIWSNEIRRYRDQALLMDAACRTLSFEGKKGDTLHLPSISRAAVYDKVAQTPVTLQARNDGEFLFQVTRHKESSFMIEDIVNTQSMYNLRSEYTREAGYALARDIDNFVLGHRASINSYDSQRIISYNNGTINTLGDGTLNAHYTGTPAPLTYAAILAAKQKLDEADVPDDGRVLYVSPAQYIQLLQITVFISVDFNAGKPLASGRVGYIAGFEVIKTSQLGINSLTGYRNGRDGIASPTPGVLGSSYLPDQFGVSNVKTTSSATDLDAQSSANWLGLPTLSGTGATAADNGQTLGLFGGANQWATAIAVGKDWCGLGIQQSTKTESSRETLYLADVCVTSNLYGAKAFRPDAAVVLHTAGF